MLPMGVGRRLPWVLCALIGLLACSVAPAHGARQMEIALEDEGAFVDRSIGDRDASFALARKLNVTRMRIVVGWNRASDSADAAPSANPDYNWAPIDDAIDAAAANGIRTMLTLTGPAPVYASGDHRSGYPIVSPDPALFGAFASAAATHFKGRVDRYSIWNEPNYPAWLAPLSRSPQLYRGLYTAGYNAIKGADPRAQVLIGETVPYGGRGWGKATAPLTWLRKLACVNARYKRVGNCAPLKADGYAHHPYEFTRAPSKPFPGANNAPIQELGRLRTALRRLARVRALSGARGAAPPLYLTESGYFVSGKRAVSASRRAAWLPQQFEIAARTPGVRSMLQYNLFVPTNSTFTTGLLKPTGTPLPEYGSLLKWTTDAVRKGLAKANTGAISLPARPAPPAPPLPVPVPLPTPEPPPPSQPPPPCTVSVGGICLVPG
jgi:Cellulase (glycosyl hydrolase family 5)